MYPNNTSGILSSMTLWLMDRPDFFLFERSWETLFLGIVSPFSLIVHWCCKPIGYISASFNCWAQSGVIRMPNPLVMSDFMALYMWGRASAVRADL